MLTIVNAMYIIYLYTFFMLTIVNAIYIIYLYTFFMLTIVIIKNNKSVYTKKKLV